MTGRDVRAVRKKLGVSQSQLAKLVGVAPNSVARWERGDRTPIGLYRKLVEKLLADDRQDY